MHGASATRSVGLHFFRHGRREGETSKELRGPGGVLQELLAEQEGVLGGVVFHHGIQETEFMQRTGEQGFDCGGAPGAGCVLGGEANEVGLVYYHTLPC
jgi:hypothetical protein